MPAGLEIAVSGEMTSIPISSGAASPQIDFTVLGGTGFIGSHVVRRLGALGFAPFVPLRGADLRGLELGTVIYCIGLTADFRSRPFDAVDAHVSVLAELVRSAQLTKLVYLSSTRVYRRGTSPASEDDLLVCAPADPDDLYDLSKAMGESITLATGVGRVVRLSNVYGTDPESPNFLASIIRDALDKQNVVFRTSLDSWKDYVSIEAAADLIVQVATRGAQEVYNVASGRNVSHRELASQLTQLTGCTVSVVPEAPTLRPPMISARRAREEFEFRPTSVLDDLPAVVRSYRALR
ncbi:MAG: NAD-dependent epimerase/dehydratase family protein [Actinobacteria bacterium]|nr:NAD-dependent epimerase/dehydratase family protein [Actinomycetota bacterium]